MKITGITVRVSGIALFHQAILGFVSAFLITSVWWLVTGSTPSLSELLISSFVLDCVVKAFLYARRAAEVRALREMYENPSAGEAK